MCDTSWKAAVRRNLLRWFDQHQRTLPWRSQKTPYRIWVSEIMLQQTQVGTVIDYYRRFMKRFPNVKRLAAASESEVLKLWEGLGYYRRARQLHAAARKIVEEHGGRFPTDYESVLALPGVGRYTAGAILSISGDQRLPILEGNTIRLFARLLAMESDPRTGPNLKVLWAFSESLLPRKRVGDFNQALMELGSLVCTPRDPGCPQCPLVRLCPTAKRSLQDVIPVSGKKVAYETVEESVVLVARGGKYLMRVCGPGERWEGLWDFPRFSVKASNRPALLESRLKEEYGLTATVRPTDFKIHHVVTRFRIELRCFEATGVTGRLSTGKRTCAWKTASSLVDLPMSVTGRKIAQMLIGS